MKTNPRILKYCGFAIASESTKYSLKVTDNSILVSAFTFLLSLGLRKTTTNHQKSYSKWDNLTTWSGRNSASWFPLTSSAFKLGRLRNASWGDFAVCCGPVSAAPGMGGHWMWRHWSILSGCGPGEEPWGCLNLPVETDMPSWVNIWLRVVSRAGLLGLGLGDWQHFGFNSKPHTFLVFQKI